MKPTIRSIALTVTVLAFPLILTAVSARAADAPKGQSPDAGNRAACSAMMQGSGMSEQGRKAMQDFMRSDKAPQMMSQMMEMAQRMGNGDTALGMTRMMEMMSSMGGGGMMGGQGHDMGGMMSGQGHGTGTDGNKGSTDHGHGQGSTPPSGGQGSSK